MTKKKSLKTLTSCVNIVIFFFFTDAGVKQTKVFVSGNFVLVRLVMFEYGQGAYPSRLQPY
jgi:hypothetical protein